MTLLRRRLDTLLERVWYGSSPLGPVLAPLALMLGALTAARRGAYGRGLMRSERVGAPVVVVGNITVGGTGKTPLLIRLAAELGARGLAVGIVTRGYGGRSRRWPRRVEAHSDAGEVGDEPVLLARRTGCPVCAGPDRVAAARRLTDEAALDILLSDDGLQHYRLARAFEIAVVDGARGLGNGRLLPAGPLREPAARLAEVDAVVVNGPGFAWPGAYRARARVTRAVPLAGGEATTLAAFAGRTVHAVVGIGHPARFFAMLRDAGLAVIEHALPDHARIDAGTLDFGSDGHPVLMTEKDAVKCAASSCTNAWYVEIDLELDDGGRLVRRILDTVDAAPGDAAAQGQPDL